MRAVNQIISYDLPFVFVALIPVVLAGSLQMSAIVAAQSGLFGWYVFYPVLGQLAFVAFLVATLAAENRVPFDILEAESELVAGFRVEYSGMKFALIQLGRVRAHDRHVVPGRAPVPGRLAGAGPGVARPALVPAQGDVRLPGRHLGALVLRAHPGRSDPGHLVEAAAAHLAGPAAGHRLRRRLPERPVSPEPTSFLGETWQLVRAVGRAMGVTLRNLFRRPVTVQYPTVKRVYPDRFRGILALVYEKDTGEEACIGCRLCECICPPQVIKVEMLKAEKRNYAKTFTLELYSCEFCELCVQVCPTDAIIMLKTFDLATSDRREMLLDKDRLHALGLAHEPSWATGNRLRDMQAPPKAARAEGKGEAKAESKAEAKEPAE